MAETKDKHEVIFGAVMFHEVLFRYFFFRGFPFMTCESFVRNNVTSLRYWANMTKNHPVSNEPTGPCTRPCLFIHVARHSHKGYERKPPKADLPKFEFVIIRIP